ncbi:hypothetical protein X12_003875 [Xanthomonas arboricola]|uniref:hypothetical protein n=1 Tax=Xanthomonas arboricola TaxID=56448 RepID=UPI000A890C10|nr:hypothetical protein [Xanthomonas arboricola]UQP99748.1 hypothetical protein KP728_08955 [Xanthomonas arboricola pv. juglandis]UQQ03031.1 hypothetical protein KP727_03490 [Xanthomonas arboricola pv. juglandis]CAD7386223.1 hypothetical protein X12_003875 [Xanthomonas arboricola]
MHMQARRAVSGSGVGFDHARSRLAVAVVSLLSLHNLAAQERTAVRRVQTPVVVADAQRGDAPVHVATAGMLW